jgi:hypothetical protein
MKTATLQRKWLHRVSHFNPKEIALQAFFKIECCLFFVSAEYKSCEELSEEFPKNQTAN